MDVNLAARLSRLAVAVLAVSGVRMAGAADKPATPEPSMLVVTATDAGESLQQPATVTGSRLAIRTDGTQLKMPAGVAGELRPLPPSGAVVLPPSSSVTPTPPAQGELTVVANPSRKGLLSSFLSKTANGASGASGGAVAGKPVQPGAIAAPPVERGEQSDDRYADATSTGAALIRLPEAEPMQPSSISLAEDSEESSKPASPPKGLLSKFVAKRSSPAVKADRPEAPQPPPVESVYVVDEQDLAEARTNQARSYIYHHPSAVQEEIATESESLADGFEISKITPAPVSRKPPVLANVIHRTAPRTAGAFQEQLAEPQELAPLEPPAERGPVAQADRRPAAVRSQPTTPQNQGSMWDNLLASGPRRPSVASGIQTQRNNTRFLPNGAGNATSMYSQLDASDEPARVAAAKPRRPEAPRPKSTDPAAELLVFSHELSLSSSTEAEYSQIVRWCAEATRQGVNDESRAFALTLSAWALNRRGQLRNDDGQRELALADFRAALEFDPDNWRALHNRGVTHAQTGQFAEAFDDVCRVVQLNPEFPKAYSNRATLYVQAGDLPAALADYQRALELNPQLVPALVGHGRVCHMTGRRDEAMASLNAALEASPDDAEIVCSRGDLLADLGRYRDALEDYAQAIDLNPHLEHAYRNGAWLLATCPEDSIRDVNGALKGAQAALDCGYGERHAALDTLAAALANAGRYEEAVGAIQQAIDIAPAEARGAYLARQQLYESRQPFRTLPVREVQSVGFEDDGDLEVISDR